MDDNPLTIKSKQDNQEPLLTQQPSLNPPNTLLVQSNGLVASMDELPLAKRRTRLLDCSSLKFGRPTKLTKELAIRIPDMIGEGSTIMEIVDELKEEGVDVTRTTIYRWADENPSFRDNLTRARQYQAHSWADESKAILDDNSNDVLDSIKGPVINNAQVHRDKSRVELRLRLAGIFNPIYAQTKDGTTVNVQVNTTVDAPKQETRDEWLARQRQALPKP